jgi:hypothetical protein
LLDIETTSVCRLSSVSIVLRIESTVLILLVLSTSVTVPEPETSIVDYTTVLTNIIIIKEQQLAIVIESRTAAKR